MSLLSASGSNDAWFLDDGALAAAGPAGQLPMPLTLSSVSGLGLFD